MARSQKVYKDAQGLQKKRPGQRVHSHRALTAAMHKVTVK